MSTFKCKKGSGTEKEKFYQGTVEFSYGFKQVYQECHDYTRSSAYVYGKAFELATNTHGITIEYEGDAGGTTGIYPIRSDFAEENSEYEITYTPSPGNPRRIKVVGERDTKRARRERITMGLPEANLTAGGSSHPNSIDLDAAYLGEIIDLIVEKNNAGDPDVKKFLLGVILLSKCR